MVDPMEEFEFRPITEGLGFHQKNNEKSESITPSRESAPAKTSSNLNLNLGLKKEMIEPKASTKELFSQPILPRAEAISPKPVASSTIEVPKFRGPKFSNPAEARKPQVKKEIDIASVLEKAKIKEQPKIIEETRGLQECPPSFLSIFLDFTVIAGLSILFLLALSFATQMDLTMIFKGIGSDAAAAAALALLVYAVAQFYMILARSFFGQTLGEWSMDSQIGTDEQQQKISYVFRLVLRTWVLAITGMIVLPIISALTQTDVAGSMSGLKLYRK